MLLLVHKLKHPLAEVKFPDALIKSINVSLLSMMLSVSWMVSHFNLSAHSSLLSRIPYIVATIATLW
jgi:hypothetical protein